jgi:hypothetical protein
LSVDLVVGPFLTLFLYRPRKPGLKFDMSVVAIIQLTALIYGTSVIYVNRPYFAVFAVDRFELVSLRDIDPRMANDPDLLRKPLVGPRLVVALLPEDLATRQRLMEEVLFEGQPDIERRPEFWYPYETRTEYVVDRAKPLQVLSARSEETARALLALADRLDKSLDELGFVPLIGRERDFAYVIDSQTGSPIELVDVDPWLDSGPEPSAGTEVQTDESDEE